MPRINWPDKTRTSAEDLNRDIGYYLIPQLETVLIKDQVIGTAQTLIAHGQLAAPAHFNVLLQGDARVWRSAVSDGLFIYLQASSAVTVDIEVIR